jgi:hypothetical protein
VVGELLVVSVPQFENSRFKVLLDLLKPHAEKQKRAIGGKERIN